MSNELLPESVNIFLDDLETSLCLPILLVIVLCTVQFVVSRAISVGCSIYQTVNERLDNDEEDAVEEKSANVMEKLKGMLRNNLGFGYRNNTETKNPLPSPPIGTNSQEEGWYYCDDDDDI
ncbi:hypothetical protein KM043_007258 [Ampulex compressa]|nr:hypothetical protein KM043_007258 [Ampulex compressa]